LQSEEDLALKQQLELYVERVQDGDPAIQKMALEAMRYAIQHPFTFGLCPTALWVHAMQHSTTHLFESSCWEKDEVVDFFFEDHLLIQSQICSSENIKGVCNFWIRALISMWEKFSGKKSGQLQAQWHLFLSHWSFLDHIMAHW
jgi:hypothetical protein